MALGSLATATNVSPMPTARAPTPMRRNVAEDVPARWPPSDVCARLVPADASSPSRAAHAASRLEVHIELHPPLGAAVVGRVVHRLHARELVETREQARVVLPVPPHQTQPVERVHHADRPVLEHV